MRTETDWEEIRRRLPERSEPGRSLREARVKSELRRLLDAHLGSTRLRVLSVEGDIPYGVNSIDVLMDAPHLAYGAQPWRPESVVRRRLLPIRIELPLTHPDRANPPRLILLDHSVYHPAALGPGLCWAELWDPTMLLTDVLREVAAMLRFERPVELQRPLNPQAARWLADGHPGFDLPLRDEG